MSFAFTDDDLKKLKNGMSTLRMAMDVTEYSLGKEELEALLARLEAAEKVLESGADNQCENLAECDCEYAVRRREWLASKGITND